MLNPRTEINEILEVIKDIKSEMKELYNDLQENQKKYESSFLSYIQEEVLNRLHGLKPFLQEEKIIQQCFNLFQKSLHVLPDKPKSRNCKLLDYYFYTVLFIICKIDCPNNIRIFREQALDKDLNFDLLRELEKYLLNSLGWKIGLNTPTQLMLYTLDLIVVDIPAEVRSELFENFHYNYNWISFQYEKLYSKFDLFTITMAVLLSVLAEIEAAREILPKVKEFVLLFLNGSQEEQSTIEECVIAISNLLAADEDEDMVCENTDCYTNNPNDIDMDEMDSQKSNLSNAFSCGCQPGICFEGSSMRISYLDSDLMTRELSILDNMNFNAPMNTSEFNPEEIKQGRDPSKLSDSNHNRKKTPIVKFQSATILDESQLNDDLPYGSLDLKISTPQKPTAFSFNLSSNIKYRRKNSLLSQGSMNNNSNHIRSNYKEDAKIQCETLVSDSYRKEDHSDGARRKPSFPNDQMKPEDPEFQRVSRKLIFENSFTEKGYDNIESESISLNSTLEKSMLSGNLLEMSNLVNDMEDTKVVEVALKGRTSKFKRRLQTRRASKVIHAAINDKVNNVRRSVYSLKFKKSLRSLIRQERKKINKAKIYCN